MGNCPVLSGFQSAVFFASFRYNIHEAFTMTGTRYDVQKSLRFLISVVDCKQNMNIVHIYFCKENDMIKKLMLLLSALLLAVVVISCSDSSTITPPIDPRLVGTYEAPDQIEVGGVLFPWTHEVIIFGTGRGTVNGFDAEFSSSNGVLIVTLLEDPAVELARQSLTVDFTVHSGTPVTVTFSNPRGESPALMPIFQALYTASPVERQPLPAPTPPVTIPTDLQGTWVATFPIADTGQDHGFAIGDTLFVINEDGTGQVWSGFTGALMNAEWEADDDTITLTVTPLIVTFDWEINIEGQLELSNPVPSDGGLAGYVHFTPVARAP